MSESHVLTSSPDTVHWGFFDSALAPVLTVRSGDEVRIETVDFQPFWPSRKLDYGLFGVSG
jgi:hypothetical protein